MTAEERLAKVERELAQLRAELAAGLTTRHVEIVDEAGEVRAALSILGNGPRLDLFDENGTRRAGRGRERAEAGALRRGGQDDLDRPVGRQEGAELAPGTLPEAGKENPGIAAESAGPGHRCGRRPPA